MSFLCNQKTFINKNIFLIMAPADAKKKKNPDQEM